MKPLLAAGIVTVALVLMGCGSAHQPATTRPASSVGGSSRVGPSAAEKREIWRALSTSRTACARGPLTSAERARVRAAVETLARLYRKYPDQGFVLPMAGSESAHMLSVLYVARQALRPCAPWAVAAIDRVIPTPNGR